MWDIKRESLFHRSIEYLLINAFVKIKKKCKKVKMKKEKFAYRETFNAWYINSWNHVSDGYQKRGEKDFGF